MKKTGLKETVKYMTIKHQLQRVRPFQQDESETIDDKILRLIKNDTSEKFIYFPACLW